MPTSISIKSVTATVQMSLYHVNVISSLSISIAAVIGAIRYKKVSSDFYPFIYLLWIGLASELLCLVIALYFKNNIVIGNIYVLIESLFLLWQFSNWMNYKSGKRKYLLIGILFFAIWLTDNLLMHDITRINSFFRVSYSFIIVFLSMEQINLVFLSERDNVLKNATFLLCAAFIVFFVFKALFEVFYMINVRMSDNFYHTLFLILVIVNFFTNLIFAIAVLWIPKKLKFTLPL